MTPSVRSRRFSWRGALYGSVLWMLLLYLLAHTVAVRVYGWQQLREWLGQDLYNALIPAGGLSVVVVVLVVLAAVDLVLSVLRAIARVALRPLAPRLTEGRQRLAAHLGSFVLLAAGVGVWNLTVTSSLRDHASVMTMRVIFGGVYGMWTVEDTVYADGFSEWGFRQVEPGMARADVEAILGTPLGIRDYGGVTWGACYTRSPRSSNYWRREVWYDRDDQVVAVGGEFWFD